MTEPCFRAVSGDGTRIAGYVSGRAEGPTVVAVHGYPDNHSVWDGLAADLGRRFRMVTYDVRGTGASDQPTTRAGYRAERLVDDLLAVIESVWDGRPVHLLGHDWGSVQCWPALTDARLAGRIASYTSVSGPALDHSSAWLRRIGDHPVDSARQALHSYYIGLFLVPRLAEVAIRRGLIDRALAAGHARSKTDAPAEGGYRNLHDKINGLELYRANVRSGLSRSEPQPIDIPVCVVAIEDDAYLIPRLCLEAPVPYVRDLRTRTISGGHWVVSRQPEVIAAIVREFVADVG